MCARVCGRIINFINNYTKQGYTQVPLSAEEEKMCFDFWCRFLKSILMGV